METWVETQDKTQVLWKTQDKTQVKTQVETRFSFSSERGARKVIHLIEIEDLSEFILTEGLHLELGSGCSYWLRACCLITGLWQPSVHSDVAF